MVFSSIIFLLYFAPVFFIIYFILPYKLKNSWLVIASLLFYWWGAPSFFVIFILSCLLDYYAINLFLKTTKNYGYYIAIISNVGMLLYFKYCNFFIDNVNLFLGKEITWAKVVLPIGISFLTFQKISYVVDVKRKHCKPQKQFSRYLLFVILFPQLIAGPIVRYKDIVSQLANRAEQITSSNIYLGLRRFIIGLAKKVLIANVLGEVVDTVFNTPAEELSSYASIIGWLAYTFQIYFDFSGYSDMAIGLGKMMGFTFPENFNFPYIAKSITEFWRRWHITLSNWMRDYLYIPLGGNQKGKTRTYLNLSLVFLISGFWHGASWNFLVWGAYHGLFLVLERLFLAKLLNKLPSLLNVLYCFVIASLGWVLFRADTLNEAIHYISAFNNFDVVYESYDTVFTTKFYTVFMLAVCFSFVGLFYEKQLNQVNFKISNKKAGVMLSHILTLVLFILCLGELFASGFNPFIYFKF